MYCIVCGAPKALHNFPKSLEKSRQWQEAMGIPFSGSNMCNQKICSKHFESHCYRHPDSVRLNMNAVPSLYPIPPVGSRVSIPVESCSSDVFDNFLSSSSLNTDVVPIITKRLKATTPIPFKSQPFSIPHPDTELKTFTDLQPSKISSSLSCKVPPPVRNHKSLFKNIDCFSFANLSPRKKNLVGIIKKKEDQLCKVKNLCKERGNDIRSISNIDKSPIVRNLFHDMPPTTANFLISQLRWHKRSPTARRWTLDDKILSLIIMKRSPKCYSLLRRIFALPSRSTLTSLLQRIPFHAGINEHLFRHLEQVLKSRSNLESICILSFDEMCIKEHVQYERNSDMILGLEDQGPSYRTSKRANHVLVFMLQGVKNNWKQPIAYYFSHGPVSSSRLQPILLEVLDACAKFGLEVIALISDMGTNNVKTLKSMGSVVPTPYISHNGNNIYTLFDPPHLLKSTRNLFRKYPIEIPLNISNIPSRTVARWNHIDQARVLDGTALGPFRCLHHLTDAHLQPTLQQTMKVKLAAQVLSATVAKFMYTASVHGGQSSEWLGTASFVLFMDKLFDSFNGSASDAPAGKETHCLVTARSAHWNFWKESLQTVSDWRFLRKVSMNSNSNGYWKPPTQIGWQHSIRAFHSICKYLINVKGFSSIRPRTFNQDALENLFGAIRSGCGCNENPTAQQFESALKTQIINGLAKQGLQGTNCEEDDESLLSNFRSLLEIENHEEAKDSENANIAINIREAIDVSAIVDEIVDAISSGNVGILATAYVSGFIAKKVIFNIHCEECTRVLTSDSSQPCNLYISFKEFSLQQDRLTYPSETLVKTVGTAITLLEMFLPQLLHDAVEVGKKVSMYINSSTVTA